MDITEIRCNDVNWIYLVQTETSDDACEYGNKFRVP
jgi:hypothetical protein